MNDETRDLLEKLAKLDDQNPDLIELGRTISAAWDMLDNEYVHLKQPPSDCPICGSELDKRINRQAWVEIVTCPRCDWCDEWDGPDDVNPASIRY